MDKLATFRVKEDNWLNFQALCKESGTNASAVLIAYIQACLYSGKVAGAIVFSSDAVTRPEFEQLRNELAELRVELRKFDAA